MSDEQLVARLRSDPEGAFRALYERHAGVLLRFIFRFIGNQEAAEEILHDVFVELLDGRFRSGPDEGLKAWLFAVARNKSLNRHRRLQTEMASAHTHDREPQTGPEERTVLDLALRRLDHSEQKLPPDLLETWRLRREGLGYRQIAERLGVPLGTVKSRFHRLVLYLKEEFEK